MEKKSSWERDWTKFDAWNDERAKKTRLNAKIRRDFLKAAGICTQGRNHGPPVEGKTLCEKCLLSLKARANKYRV